MKTIPLSQGQHALVDDEDYANLSNFKWAAQRGKYTFYARRHVGQRKYVFMHRMIIPFGPGIKIDHKDGNGLNNRRHNLRRATHSQNLCGFRGGRINKTSKYRGVSFRRDTKKWRAVIYLDNKMFCLGSFESEFSAALAYDKRCRELFGSFASPNFLVS